MALRFLVGSLFTLGYCSILVAISKRNKYFGLTSARGYFLPRTLNPDPKTFALSVIFKVSYTM